MDLPTKPPEEPQKFIKNEKYDLANVTEKRAEFYREIIKEK